MRFFAFALLLFSTFAYAESCRVGEVLRVVGAAKVQRQSQLLTPVAGLKICQGDRVITEPGSLAELRLRDGTLITVGKSSEFVIRDYRIYKEQPNVALFELVSGAFRCVTGLITKRPHRFEVETKVASIGIRGTDFWGGYGLTENALDVVMLEGHGVYVKNAIGNVELDKPGLGTTVLPEAMPMAAKAWGEAKIKRAMAAVTP